jgi:hypothetical protein
VLGSGHVGVCDSGGGGGGGGGGPGCPKMLFARVGGMGAARGCRVEQQMVVSRLEA